MLVSSEQRKKDRSLRDCVVSSLMPKYRLNSKGVINMARVIVSLAEVAAAFEKLLTQGSAPSAANIQSVLGKGTETQIQKHINTLIDQSKRDLQVPLALEPTPAEAVVVHTPAPETLSVETSAPAPPEAITVTQLPPQAEPRRPQFQVKKFERRDNKGPRNSNHPHQKNNNTHHNATGINY